ncbi:MAG TPA: protein kinase [Polyangiaceae bacterium]|nr:MAG: Serine/threonine-protein kinase PknL [Deltaproteobacteria bacterium ADurb.Bin207]HNS97346.1 protein kinase [Polyangiaceae bacterium]HNZ21772.1 protein kinase [Polyangiaceae bacterium]HOD25021.1 protein kinase [Polyangiaceae bacterium]HOE51363.1 protein kinase [Polyangiaceae bacterium]
MDKDTLRSELERLFDLEELMDVSRDVLGISPDEVGHTASKALFAKALVDRCVVTERVEALLDSLITLRPTVDRKALQKVSSSLVAEHELPAGSSFGPFVVRRKVGSGPSGSVYLVKRDDRELTLKVLHPLMGRDRGSFARFAAATRLFSRVSHEGLPTAMTLGNDEGLDFVAYDYIDGQSLASRTARSGPMHINEARSLLQKLLDVLVALHDQRLVHGNIKLSNILVARGSEPGKQKLVLLDPAFDRLRLLRSSSSSDDVCVVLSHARSVSPEQLRGVGADERSDVYSFGAVMYEILTGKPLFSAGSALEYAIATWTQDPEPPIQAAPRGWVAKEVSDFIMSLLAREPSLRPKDARAVLERFEMLGRVATQDDSTNKISDEELSERIDALVISPDDEAAIAALDEAAERGGDVAKIAQALVMAADQIETTDSDGVELRKSLLFRSARLYESKLKDLPEAEKLYVWISELDPADEIADAALEEVRRQLGKTEEVVEMLLARIERAADSEEKATAMAEIGRLYASELEDASQAVVAYAQAFVESPKHVEFADAIERIAGSDVNVLGEAMAILAESTQTDIPIENKNLLFLRLGHWYGKRLGRYDAALPCYQAVIATDPVNDGALEGMAALFKANQQYMELGQVLMRRAEAASTPARSREFRLDAAELLETRLGEPAKAKELYEQVLAEDPSHDRATEALLGIYEKEDNAASLVKILTNKAERLSGSQAADIWVRAGDVYETKLKDMTNAIRCFESAVQQDETNQRALDALDRLHTQSRHFKELLATIERKINIATTPRQKIVHLERISKLHAEEFLDHVAAAQSLEKILEIDPAHSATLEALAHHYRALDRWSDVANVYERDLNLQTDKAKRLDVLLMLARVVAERLSDPARAMKVYEQALEIEPGHAGALEALAALRQQSGDSQAALQAIEALAEKASSPNEKAEQYIRAAKLLQERDDVEGAMERYRLALDANPRAFAASAALRALYLDRGEVTSAIELIAKEREYTEAPNIKAKLCAEAAKLARNRLKDATRAELSAKEALEYDENQVDASTILGDLAFENDRPVEALHYYGAVIPKLEQLPKQWAISTLRRFITSLARTQQSDKALAACEQLLEFAPDDLEASIIAGRILFEHGDAKRAFQVHQDILDRFGDKLVGNDKSGVLYRYGESARKAGDAIIAIKSLTESADMDPTAAEPLAALAKVHESKGEWEDVIRIKSRRLDVAEGDERVQLLVDIGEICSSKLDDKTRAAKSFMAALEERPDDRKLLTRLMQLYSENKDWTKLVEVVLKLADFVEDPKQKAKYVHTAAMVTGQQIGDVDKALELLDTVRQLDPDLESSITEAIKLREKKGDFEGIEKLLNLRLERATEKDDRDTVLATFDALGALYKDKLGWMTEAIDAFEAAQMLDPDNTERNSALAEMYASNPTDYLDKAVSSQHALLSNNPNNPAPYKLLRRLYTEAKRADGAWCLCQALAVLNLAEPDEDRFYRRMRSETAAPAQDRVSPESWAKHLVHPDADPVLTSLLAVIEPAVLATRADTLENLGYDPRYAIDLSLHPYPMSQTIYYAAGVLGMDPPPTFQNINDEGGISFLHAQIPSIVLGRAAFEVEVPNQAAAFIVGRHLSYYRPGMYIRHLIPTGTGLKAWVFAAIKMNSPQFPISADLEGPIAENLNALNVHLTGASRERLASLVSKLLQSSGAMNLKKWVAAVDLTADRAGLLVAHDLEIAAEMIKASDESISPVTHKDRLRELVLYSISEPYLALRQQLGIAIDS